MPLQNWPAANQKVTFAADRLCGLPKMRGQQHVYNFFHYFCEDVRNGFSGVPALFDCPTYAPLTMKQWILVLVLSGVFGAVRAQGYLEAGVSLGASSLFSDINQSTYMYSPSVAAGVTGRYVMDSRSAVSLGVQFSRLRGNDADFGREWRGVSHTSNLVFAGLQYEFNFLPFSSDYAQNRYLGGSSDRKTYPFSPYIFLGAGVAFGQASIETLEYVFSGSPPTTISSKQEIGAHFEIPFGAGMRFRLSQTVSATMEAGFRKTTSDLLEGLTTTPDAPSGSLRNSDWPSYVAATVLFKIPGSHRLCAAFGGNSAKEKKVNTDYVFD